MFKLYSKDVKSVGFLGLGKSNLGVFEYLSKHIKNLDVTVRNNSPADVSFLSPRRVFFGKETLQSIEEDILFISPSARRDIKELKDAAARGVILSSDAELFFENTAADVFCVTGSDGKSTTTYLTSRLISDNCKKAVAFGNIGQAMSPYLDGDENTRYVAELSSFQLMYLKPKSERSIITNVTENHLNWHTSFEEYINAKRSVFENSKNRVVNFDCEISRRIAKDYSIFAVFSTENDENTLKKLIKAELYVTLADGIICVSGEPVLKTHDIKTCGHHNVLNFMSAIAMSYGLYEKENLTSLAREFGGLAHRCELVGELNGVSYYDSSIDSSPKRCAATLSMLSDKLIVILGGRSKKLDFSELMPILKRKAKLVIIMGECQKEIEDAVISYEKSSDSVITYKLIDNFYDAIDYATTVAEPGDKVVLSPGATSYDNFANFEERGEAFKLFLKSKGI